MILISHSELIVYVTNLFRPRKQAAVTVRKLNYKTQIASETLQYEDDDYSPETKRGKTEHDFKFSDVKWLWFHFYHYNSSINLNYTDRIRHLVINTRPSNSRTVLNKLDKYRTKFQIYITRKNLTNKEQKQKYV